MRLRALLLFLATSASAQTASPDTLGEVTVTAAREAVSTREAPVRVTVLGRDALDASAAASAADALSARAPVHVRRYGPSGLASVTIRGASSSQALVLLDGQPLTDPQLGQVDLSLLPLALVEAVEVLSGPASGLYGSAALGGVIHLRPPTASGTAGRVLSEVGPWGERRASGLATVRSGHLRAVVAADASQADDDYTVQDRGRLDARRTARAGWDSDQTSAYASLAAGDRVCASVWAADSERGLGGTDAVGERQWDRRLRLAAFAQQPTRWGRLEATASLQRASLRYANPYPALDRPDAIDDTGETVSALVDLRATRAMRSWTWTGALAAGTGRGEHPSLADAARDRFVGLALTAVGAVGTARLFPSLRADLYAPAGGDRQLAVSPQLGANVALSPRWRLKASAASAFRMPTLNDRFWLPGGNPNLRPERAWSADAGVVWSALGAEAEATAFATTARDQIVWSPTASGYWAPANVARTRTFGLEASARIAGTVDLGRPARAEAGALATVVDARDLGTDFPLRYVPRWTTKAWGALSVGTVRLDLGARVVGARFTTASGSQPLPPYAVVDGQLSVRQRVGAALLTLGVAAENLTGVQYEVVRSYPMPPRHARLRLSLHL